MSAGPGVQHALARLLADPDARRCWDADPVSFATTLGLSATDAARLSAVRPVGVAITRQHIGRKRIRALRHFLPLTFRWLDHRGLAEEVQAGFIVGVAPRSDPASHRRIACDAAALRDYLFQRAAAEPVLEFVAGLAAFEYAYSELVTRPPDEFSHAATPDQPRTDGPVMGWADRVDLVLCSWDFPALVGSPATWLDADPPEQRTGVVLHCRDGKVRVLKVPVPVWRVLSSCRDGATVADLARLHAIPLTEAEEIVRRARLEGLLVTAEANGPER